MEHNFEPGRPPCDFDDPADRDRLVSELVDDANELVWAAEDLVDNGVVLSEKQADAVALLALVAGQDSNPAMGLASGVSRSGVAKDRVISTVDPEARHAHKTRRAYRDGFKGHVAAEPETGLITACDIGPGNEGDTIVAAGLIADEPAGTEILGDSGYSAGEFRAHLQNRDMHPVIKPQPLRPAVDGGFTLDDFTIDTAAGTVTCPENITVAITPAGAARFAGHCRTCPVRHLCTTAKAGRVISLHPQHDLLAAARTQAETDEFDAVYRQQRPMIERTLAWLTRNIGACATEESNATSSAGLTAAPPSTSNAFSRSASPTTTNGPSPNQPERTETGPEPGPCPAAQRDRTRPGPAERQPRTQTHPPLAPATTLANRDCSAVS